MMQATPDTQPSFETAFAELQNIITRLENTELPLEEALRLYEEGKRLSVVCASILENAQLRVSALSEANPSQPAVGED
ncbi:MAG: exodeoxyribonuclease VII small subunit [Chloroflexi bacterium]|jgi:exodeoxyribonuclease VII small subunit|nr:exodeoxyribonuclease VII small subunit [Anaerolineaceae bacterium]NLI44423.1 exodeoxyribonuclease VII small subunit [Chloroflexota bacterium]HOE34460.1 exodeoxyribonuclease VII small subunit [Anaerolineaceae bacterium]HOT25470.1 exodeoxyribonuclease VII small subunit [Anaerolineaceae bacterium]HQH57456.1 exodeoxyribonuclease VII small subunit [Anaerolineaceae bacterium]